ncbi:unnamed protein product [Amoebophrya sp. A120]|nr:unnamed protein product [Amoebophrya sp. A120]|eukprot:GSA120T00012835001.1
MTTTLHAEGTRILPVQQKMPTTAATPATSSRSASAHTRRAGDDGKSWYRRDTRKETQNQAHERLYRIPEHRRPGFKPPLTAAVPNCAVSRRPSRKSFRRVEFHNSAMKPTLLQRDTWLQPEPELTLTRANVARYFMDKLDKGYQLEKTKTCGAGGGAARSAGGAKWDDRIRPWTKAGYTGDFHDPVSNPGYGRAPYGGIFTNFR